MQSGGPDVYELLGVDPDCSFEELRSAYRAQARLLHPDRLGRASDAVRAAAGERLAQINVAWDLVDTPEKRAVYDAALPFRAREAERPRARRTRDPFDFLKGREPVDPAYSFETGTWVAQQWLYTLLLKDGRADVLVGPVPPDDPRREVAKFKLRTSLTDLSRLDQIPATDLDILYVHSTLKDRQLDHVKRFTGLIELALVDTDVTDDGVARIAHLDRLRRLDLQGSKITEGVAPTLVALPNLEALELGGTKVTDAIIPALLTCPRLEQLGLRGTKVTARGVSALTALPRLKILTLSFATRLRVVNHFRKERPDVEVI